MAYTNFPNGLTSFGVPVVPGQFPTNVYGTHWFVDGNLGSDSYEGTSADRPKLTMDAVFDLLSSGDVIHARGNFREQLTTPAGVFDVTIIGECNNTRHPDAHTSNGGYSSVRWNAPASPTASTPLLKIQQQGWRIFNILFTGDENDGVGCIQLFRDGGSGDDERDASHAEIIGCRFATGLYGIQDSGGCARIKILNCEFQQFTESDNDAIVSVTGAGIGTKWGWQIKGNTFQANYSDIDADLTGAEITDNHFHLVSLGTTNVIAIDMTGGARNWVCNNHMYSAFDLASSANARFVLGTNDLYGPNYYSSGYTVGEPTE